jgi:hypothetical protein
VTGGCVVARTSGSTTWHGCSTQSYGAGSTTTVVTISRHFIPRCATSTGALRTGRWRNTNACDGIDGEPSIGRARLPRAIQLSLLTGRCCIGHRLDGKSRMSGDVQVRIRERLGVRLPRATRLVILIHAHPRHGWLLKAVDKRLREELAKLHVQINEQKSRTVNLARGESFGFLGFDFRRVRNLAGRWRPQYAPKLKKRTALLQTLREIFRRHRSQPVQWVVEQINPILRGWVNYFAIGYSSRCFQFVKRWVEIKVRRHLMRARKCRGLGWERWSTQWLHANLGLFTGYRLRRDLRKVTSVA